MHYKSLSVLLFGAALTLVGCSNLSSTPSPATTSVSLASTVSGSSSLLLVNGQSLDVSGASVTVDDEPGSASDVKPGMEISGDGSSDGQGKLKMKNVQLNWRMKGALDAIDATNSTLDVGGLQAKVDASTLIFKEDSSGETALTFGDLAQGNYVRLSGLPQSDDSVLATRIEVYTPSDPTATAFMVLARNLDTTAKTLTYGLKTISVDFSKATINGTPSEGGLVRVKGTRSSNTVSASLLKAPGSKSPNPNPPTTGQKVELRGSVSGLDSVGKTFVVNGITVNYSNASVEGTLADKVIVEVRATLSGTTTADALKVEVEDQNEHGKPDGKKGGSPTPVVLKLEGTISSFDGTAKTLKIHGIPVSVTAATTYEVAANTQWSGTEVTADVFWGTNHDGAQAQAVGAVVGGSFVASKIETK